MKKISNQWHLGKVCLAVAIIVSVCFPFIGVAADDAVSSVKISKHRIDNALTREMIIREKTPMDILAGEQRFSVSTAAVIMSEEALQITLKEMPVPCKALIYYEASTAVDPEAVKIEIKEVLAGASTEWAMAFPD